MVNVSGQLCLLAGIGIGGLLGAYGIYMGFGPGGDGIIFATVASGVVGIVAGIGGFRLGRTGFSQNSPAQIIKKRRLIK
jgi:hypothetical protein